MKINGISEAQSAKPTRKTKKTDTAFSTDKSGSTSNAAAPSSSPVSAQSTLSALIALQTGQTGQTSSDGRRKTLAAAQRTLDLLDSLQLRMLAGEISVDDISALNEAATIRGHADAEPELLAIYDEINLRARVELAKIDHF